MRSFKLRDATTVILGSLAAAVALTQAGCLNTQHSGADGTAPGGESAESDELKDPMLRAFGEALGDADDLEDSDRDEAWEILREADPILTRVKDENRKALEAANRPPRITSQRGKKPKPDDQEPKR